MLLQAQIHASSVRRLPEGGAGGRAESHPACSVERSLCRGSSPLRGSDAPSSGVREGLITFMGYSFTSEAIRKGCRGRAESPLLAAIGNNFAVSKSPWWGLTRRLRRGLGLAVPRGAHTFLSMAKEKCAKEEPAARRLQRRPAPLRTAAKPCATLVLGYALHGLRPFLALVGLRPPLVAGFVLR